MPRPNSLGIGTQRAGTTFLHTVLSRHPQIAMPRTGTDAWNKEQHFFNRFILSSDLAAYEEVFADPNKPDAVTAGEITPAYATLPRYLVSRIESYLPSEATRIIFIVRNPVERIVSAYKQFHRIKCRKLGGTELARSWRFIRYGERPGVIGRTDYARAISNWRSVFGVDRVLVLQFDVLARQPVATFRRIAAFLGVDPEWFTEETVPAHKVYASASDTIPAHAKAYIAWRWLPATRRLNTQMGGALDPWVASMEEEIGRCGRSMRAGFRAARVLAWSRQAIRRYRLASQFRRIDARLRTLLASQDGETRDQPAAPSRTAGHEEV